jgi:hypothetical protein
MLGMQVGTQWIVVVKPLVHLMYYQFFVDIIFRSFGGVLG